MIHLPVALEVEPSPSKQGLATGSLGRNRKREVVEPLNQTPANDGMDDIPRRAIVVTQRQLARSTVMRGASSDREGLGGTRRPRVYNSAEFGHVWISLITSKTWRLLHVEEEE